MELVVLFGTGRRTIWMWWLALSHLLSKEVVLLVDWKTDSMLEEKWYKEIVA